MAIEILKPGKDTKEEWVYFNCDRCGCEFRVTIDETDDDYYVSYSGACPNCGRRLSGKLETKE